MIIRKVAMVFGGSGFIGSHIVDLLLSMGYRVINVDTWDREILTDNYYQSGLYIDENKNCVYELINKHKPTVIFNLIAVMSLKQCSDDPVHAVKCNQLTNISIVNSIEDYNKGTTSKVHLYVYASSIYAGNNISGIYGITKRASEDYIKWMSKQNGMNYLILRYGTVYGPRSMEENSIHKIIKNALDKKVISLYGTGEETRDYIHVKDVALATIELMNLYINRDLYTKDENNGNRTYYIGGTRATSADHLAKLLKDILGSGYDIEFRKENPIDHYRITPYVYECDIPLKYNLGVERDLGSGLLDMINHLQSEKLHVNQ